MIGTSMVYVSTEMLDDWDARAAQVRQIAAWGAEDMGGVLLDAEPEIDLCEGGAHVRYQMRRVDE